jgi:hypothetical protein
MLEGKNVAIKAGRKLLGRVVKGMKAGRDVHLKKCWSKKFI